MITPCVLHAKLINSECMGGHKDITTYFLMHSPTFTQSFLQCYIIDKQ